MSKAYFYVLPWSVVKAQQDRSVQGTLGLSEPMCCHESTSSWESLAADPTQQVFAHVHWGSNWAARERFEAQPGVICLGEPWELVPPAAIPLLEQFRTAYLALRAERVGVVGKNGVRSELDASAPIDGTHTVTAALRKAYPMMAHELF